jgi:hypothetical protein
MREHLDSGRGSVIPTSVAIILRRRYWPLGFPGFRRRKAHVVQPADGLGFVAGFVPIRWDAFGIERDSPAAISSCSEGAV